MRVPLPTLTRVTVPEPLLSRPENVVLVLSPPTVNVTGAATDDVTLPAPAIEPRAASKPARSRVAPEATVVALLGPIALAVPSLSVPALIVVTPVYDAASESVNVPAPSLVKVAVVPVIAATLLFPAPPTVSERVLALMPFENVNVPPSLLTRVVPTRVIAPDQSLSLARLRKAPPNATPVPVRLPIGSATARLVPSISIAAPLVTLVPVADAPSAAELRTRRTPTLTVVAPE